MAEAKLGVIGGSGLYQMEGMTDIKEVDINTPFGKPSDTIILGSLEGMKIAFLPRHGRGHRISPSELPVQANIYALKSLGVEWIISVSAVGSLKEEIHPLDIVIPDQVIDCTKGRASTFFQGGIVAHVAFADPFCPVLRQIIYKVARDMGVKVHNGGTYLAMEGPQFSTKAESQLYRSWGASVIGMTAIPEAKLAREAEICYATLACVSDYDCWHESHEPVTVDMILSNLQRNVEGARKVIKTAASGIPEKRECGCASALKDAIVTSPERIPAGLKRDLALLIGKYVR